MVFNSNSFIFLLLPVCLAVYYLLLKKNDGNGAKYWLIVISLVFYAGVTPWLLIWLVGSVLINILFLRRISQWGKKILVPAVLFNLLLLCCGRYFSVIPVLGISFFTFQQISFLIDRYRGEVEDYHTLDYILFVLYFPKLLQGPIALHSELMPQFRNLHKIRFDAERFYRGLVLFVLGLAKKVLLAETLGQAVGYGYSNLLSLNTPDALVVMLSFSLQIYFDFSGYCDMAMGVSRMLGIELPVNFDSPYQSADIVGFWRKWHMTLTRFLTRYVYIALGGNRRGKGRMYANLLLVFLVSGLWHGAGLPFIVWGMMHGLLYVVTRMVQDAGTRRKGAVMAVTGNDSSADGMAVTGNNSNAVEMAMVGSDSTLINAGTLMRRKILSLLKTTGLFIYVTIAWVFFRASSMQDAGVLLKAAFQFRWQRIGRQLADCFNVDEFWYIIKVIRLDRWEYGHYVLMFLFLFTALLIVLGCKNTLWRAGRFRPGVIGALVLAGLFVWCVISLSGVSTFIYLNF